MSEALNIQIERWITGGYAVFVNGVLASRRDTLAQAQEDAKALREAGG